MHSSSVARRGRWRKVWAAMLGALLGACAGHKAPPPSTDIDEIGFRDAVRILAADDFEGRRPGTAGEDKTVTYLTAQFRRFGLKPGNGESFIQAVPMIELHATGPAAFSISGRGSPAALQAGKDLAIWSPREAADTAVRGSEVVFVGYGIVAPEYDWNDYRGTDVRGKTVIVMAGDPGTATHDSKLFRGDLGSFYGRWPYKVSEAGRQGAAAVLVIHPGTVGVPSWDSIVADASAVRLELAPVEGGTQRVAVEGWLAEGAAQTLFSRAGLDYAAALAAAGKPGFTAAPLGLTADADVHATVRRFSSPNVIGVLPGERRKREYLLYTAHWDHLGRDGESIRNGAVDDASGVAGLLMLAQSFSRTQPHGDRSIAFVVFTGGDYGLLGSSYYIDNPVLPLRDTVAAINLDMLHVGGPTRDVMVFGAGNSELEEFVRDAAPLQGREMRADAVPEYGMYYRSDQYSFARGGIPALYAVAGMDDAARGPVFGRAQFEDYMAHRYRRPADKYSADWDVRAALDDLRLYYEIGGRLAGSRRFPRWYPTSEFRSHPPRQAGNAAQ